MILAAGLLLALALPLIRLAVRGNGRVRLSLALLSVPLAWAAVFGIFRLVAYLTQRALPEPSFTSPPLWLALAAAPIALALGLVLLGRSKIGQVALAEAGILLASLALNYHASFPEDAIRLRATLSFSERRYGYEQVRSVKYVTHARSGSDLAPRPRFVIELDDGTLWTTDDGMRRTIAHVDVTAIELVCGRSNRILQNVLTIDSDRP